MHIEQVQGEWEAEPVSLQLVHSEEKLGQAFEQILTRRNRAPHSVQHQLVHGKRRKSTNLSVTDT